MTVLQMSLISTAQSDAMRSLPRKMANALDFSYPWSHVALGQRAELPSMVTVDAGCFHYCEGPELRDWS